MNNVSFEISDFINLGQDEFRGILVDHHKQNHVELASLQTFAWDKEYNDLRSILQEKDGRILFEYSIPSLSKTIDVVLLLEGKIFVIEYKSGETDFNKTDIIQTQRYALLLKYCHSTSNSKLIVPILVATDSTRTIIENDRNDEDGIYNTILTNSADLKSQIEIVCTENSYSGNNTWESVWEEGIYKASPTIIEAAKNVWRENNVQGFTLGESDAKTRLAAEDYIKKVVKETQERQEGYRKSICFVTGVPGAGKTLVGLNLSVALQDYGASMLSGNGPLVAVMSTALKRDYNNYKKNKAKLKDEVSINSIIRDAYGYKKEIFEKRLVYEKGTGNVSFKEGADRGSQHAIIFDEAQRAWTQEKMIKPGQAGKKYWQEELFPFSEPGLLLWDMNLKDWGVFVCLVGGGQEIHDGEAGICEWLKALKDNKELSGWHIYMADELKGPEYNRTDDDNQTIEDYRKYFAQCGRLTVDSSLHLTACQRTPRSERVSALIHAILECDVQKAKSLYDDVSKSYPIYLTRDLDKAKNKLRERQKLVSPINENLDDTRIGMLMSSNAGRLRPFGYPELGASITNSKIASWFLDTSDNVNSSNFLEIALDEFSVQGLELDLDVLMWDGDFRYNPATNNWNFYKFNGKYWSSIKDEKITGRERTKEKVEEKKAKNRKYETTRFYMKNAYRVLLTRARKGMIIFVPEGSNTDITRSSDIYDNTFNYLSEAIGIKELK